MTDYSELVKALRGCKDIDYCTDCPRMEDGYTETCNIKDDAANAIEALQAEVAGSKDAIRILKHNLEMKLPKRGEWIHNTAVYGTTTGGLTVEHHYTCSVCGGLMGRKGDKFCYNCGAKMMEVQDGENET